MTEREGRPGEEYAGAAQKPGSGAVAKYTPKGYRSSPSNGNHRTETNDFLAELAAIFAEGQRNGQAHDTNGQATNPEPESQGDAPVEDSGDEENPSAEDGPQRLEDAHIGERIAKDHLQEFLHTKGFGWLKFDGRKWKPVEETNVCETVRQALIDFHQSEAQKRAEPSRLEQISNRIRAITYITKSCAGQPR
jgi:hypothetical protein